MGPFDEDDPGADFQVELARAGRTITVPSGQSILHALLAADVDVAYSCEEGMCGACEVTLLSGKIRHRDTVRSPAENDRLSVVMICCARSLSDTIVLDI